MGLFRKQCNKSPNGLHSAKRHSDKHTEIHNGKEETYWTHVLYCHYCGKILSKPVAGK